MDTCSPKSWQRQGRTTPRAPPRPSMAWRPLRKTPSSQTGRAHVPVVVSTQFVGICSGQPQKSHPGQWLCPHHGDPQAREPLASFSRGGGGEQGFILQQE